MWVIFVWCVSSGGEKDGNHCQNKRKGTSAASQVLFASRTLWPYEILMFVRFQKRNLIILYCHKAGFYSLFELSKGMGDYNNMNNCSLWNHSIAFSILLQSNKKQYPILIRLQSLPIENSMCKIYFIYKFVTPNQQYELHVILHSLASREKHNMHSFNFLVTRGNSNTR